MLKFPKNLRTLDNKQPHPSWEGWAGFLNSCENRGEADGVVFYGKSNCNYLLFPNGIIIQNFGFWGNSLLEEIRNKGRKTVLADIATFYNLAQSLQKKINQL